jgi:hypothetical protein
MTSVSSKELPGRLPEPPSLHYSPRSCTLVLPKYMAPFRELFLSGDVMALKIFAKLNAFLIAVHFEHSKFI